MNHKLVLRRKLWIAGGLGLSFAVAGVVSYKIFYTPLYALKAGRFIASTPLHHMHDLVDIYAHAWDSFKEKARTIREVHEDNKKLQAENTRLKYKLETLEFSTRSKNARKSTEARELKLSQETGSKAGRTLASLSYKPPQDLLPSQLYTLGISYFKAHEDEKAAVIFTSLANLTDTDTYRSAKHLVATGVAWYRVENYSLADIYFGEVLKKPETEINLRYQAQARLWKALVAKRLNKEMKSQYWLKELLDHHSHAPETSWINPPEVKGAKHHED